MYHMKQTQQNLGQRKKRRQTVREPLRQLERHETDMLALDYQQWRVEALRGLWRYPYGWVDDEDIPQVRQKYEEEANVLKIMSVPKIKKLKGFKVFVHQYRLK